MREAFLDTWRSCERESRDEVLKTHLLCKVRELSCARLRASSGFQSRRSGDTSDAVQLAYFEGLKDSEVSELLQIPVAEVRRRMLSGMRSAAATGNR